MNIEPKMPILAEKPLPIRKLFTTDELKAVANGLYRTWNTIAEDCMNAMLEGRRPYLLRGEVVEIVLDASYLESYGGMESGLLKRFRDLPYDRMKKVARDAFPHERYV
jgi:hypothetical protein